jgi:hypothetical protein
MRLRLSVLYPDRNQIFLGGQHRGACPLSPELQGISQRRCRPTIEYVVRTTSASFGRFFPSSKMSLLLGEPSKWPLVIINDAGWQTHDGGLMVGYAKETGYSRSTLSEAFSVTSVIQDLQRFSGAVNFIRSTNLITVNRNWRHTASVVPHRVQHRSHSNDTHAARHSTASVQYIYQVEIPVYN